jgi:hypothetical protein
MSIHIPKGTMPVCFMRGQQVRGIGAELYVAKTQISVGKPKEAKLMLSMAWLGLKTLTDISPKKVAKEALSLRKRVIAVLEVVESKKTSTKKKISAVEALAGDFQKLERSAGLSCGYEA